MPRRFANRLLLPLLLLTLAGGASAEPRQLLPRSDGATDALERLAELKTFLAEQLGLPVDSIREDSDLERDLGVEAMDAWEAVAMFCERQGVDPPARTPASVGEILRHVEAARRGGAVMSAAEPEGIVGIELLYGTTRERRDERDPYRFYGGERSRRGDHLEMGRCRVEIPVAAHRRGHLEGPSGWKLQRRPDPRKHIVLTEVDPLAEDAFRELLRRTLDERGEGLANDLLVFIHGYNITFAKAARRTAQLAYDLEYPGALCLFSWPSDGKLLKYLSDREDVEWSVPHCERFLELLLAEAGPGRIHLVAHSMGNQALIRTLHAMALRRGEGAEALFGSVILAAPDFDARAFTENIAPLVRPLAERWTVYASDHDRALDASTVLAAKRLGLPLSLTPDMDTVDVSGVDVSPWSMPEMHAYYASKARVIADMIDALRNLDPSTRNLTAADRDGRPFWRLVASVNGKESP